MRSSKFLKDLCIQKLKDRSKSQVLRKVFSTEQVSIVIMPTSPPKLKDPGVPTISYTTENYSIEKALVDLGVSVNLLPYLYYEQFNLGEIKPTTVTLQLAERSVRVPHSVIENVLV